MKRIQIFILLLVVVSMQARNDSLVVNLYDDDKSARMFVFPADADNNSQCAIVLCPGGGYSRLSMNNEGFDWVPFFRSMGFTTVVLQYRMPKGNPQIPVGDASKAMHLLRERAVEWGFNSNKVGIMGFSAGGHLASTITVSEDSLVRPDFSVLFYPVITMSQEFMHVRSHNELLGEHATSEVNDRYSSEKHVTEQTPPTFLALSNDDRTVFPLNSTSFYEALLAKNRPASLHVYPTGRHGWGFRRTFTYHEQMKSELSAWLQSTVMYPNGQPPMRLWYKEHARYFEESLPIGNGHLGALVYGGADSCTIYLNDITMWTGKPVDRNEGKDVSDWLPKIREALFAENYKLADALQLHMQGHNCEMYQPLATMKLYDLNKGEVTSYRRELNLDSAYVNDRYQRDGVTYTREYIASNPDRLIAFRLKANRKGALNVRLALTAQIPYTTHASASDQLTMEGHALGDASETVHFCTITRIGDTDGEIKADSTGISLMNATEATVYFINETSYNGPRNHPVRQGAPYQKLAKKTIARTASLSYNDVRTRHITDYQQFYCRVKLQLGNRQFLADMNTPTNQLLKDYTTKGGHSRYLEMLHFQYGRYLLISCSRTKGLPANLQGLWTPHVRSPWKGNYTIDINLQENYWPAYVSNLTEMAEPLDGFISALAENGRYTARNFYGIDRGWCSSHNSDLWAMSNPVGEGKKKPIWANWNLGGAWLVWTLWDRYLFTQDEQYLRKTAYPLMKGAADFMLDWLIDNPKQPGELITAPCTSPENAYITDKGYGGYTLYGATADLAIIRELFLDVIAAGRICGEDVGEYQAALEKLHPYTIGAEGDLNEWYYDWQDKEVTHRHQSHLIGLYPGSHIKEQPLLDACEKTLIQKGDVTTGWSTGWRINLWARLKNAENAYKMFRRLLKYVDPWNNKTGTDGGTYPNLFDAHPPFQIDGNFGGTAGVCEMLLQSSVADGGGATIELLPALPTEWSEGRVNGLLARGGYKVSMEWQRGNITCATIKAKRDGSITILYNGKQKKMTFKAGETKTLR